MDDIGQQQQKGGLYKHVHVKKGQAAAAKSKPKERRPSIIQALKSIPALAKWPERDLKQIHDSLNVKTYKDGEEIVHAGDEQNALYIVRVGEVQITTPEVKRPSIAPGHRASKVGTIRAMFEAAGDGRRAKGFVFGDFILSQLAGSSTSRFKYHVHAVGAVVLLTISYAQFMLIKMLLAKRVVVANEAYQPDLDQKKEKKAVASLQERERGVSIEPTVKTEAEQKTIMTALKQVVLLKGLEEGQLHKIIDTMWEQEIKKETTLIQQGEKGEVFYVVKRGEFNVFIDDVYVAKKPGGAGFGELALMHNALRSATVVAAVDSAVWCVYRWQVRRIIADYSANNIRQRLEFLNNVKTFDVLFDAEKRKLAEVLEDKKYQAGDVIVRQGDEGDSFFILKEGEVKVEVEDKDGSILPVSSYKPGDYFGELSLMTKKARAATVTATLPTSCLILTGNHFELLLGSMSELFASRRTGYRKSIETSRRAKHSISEPKLGSSPPASPFPEGDAPSEEEEKKRAQIEEERLSKVKARLVDVHSLEELTVIGTLGRGAFGHVQLVKDKNGATHALKTLNKSLLVETKQAASVKRERDVLAYIDHPFVIQFRGWFQDKNHMHLIMEPTLGGELASVLSSKQVLSEDEARFMAANIVIAFEYLHLTGICYRDLKPENVLLDSQGYLKFIDFGFAKRIAENKTYTLCGTPDYLSPEVISGQGHEFSADWWTLGIVIYEMLLGETPFYADTPMGTYSNIMKCELVIPEDAEISKEAKDIIRQLLKKEAPLRLGATKGGAQCIKDHPWFTKASFDWKAVEDRKMVAPIVPEVENEEDIHNFEDYLGEDERWKSYHASLLGEPDPFADF